VTSRIRLALLPALLLAACAGPRDPTAMHPFAGAGATPAIRAAQIQRAALGLGWSVEPEKQPGRMVLHRDGQSVAVTYTDAAFALQPGAATSPTTLRDLDRSVVAQSSL
jgi:hypothetical protein